MNKINVETWPDDTRDERLRKLDIIAGLFDALLVKAHDLKVPFSDIMLLCATQFCSLVKQNGITLPEATRVIDEMWNCVDGSSNPS